jgi:hypothetical protein
MCFPMLALGDCTLTRPFLATSGARNMVTMMHVVVMVVRISCLYTACRRWKGPWQHALRGRARFSGRLLQSGCRRHGRKRRRQRGARHRAVLATGRHRGSKQQRCQRHGKDQAAARPRQNRCLGASARRSGSICRHFQNFRTLCHDFGRLQPSVTTGSLAAAAGQLVARSGCCFAMSEVDEIWRAKLGHFKNIGLNATPLTHRGSRARRLREKSSARPAITLRC